MQILLAQNQFLLDKGIVLVVFGTDCHFSNCKIIVHIQSPYFIISLFKRFGLSRRVICAADIGYIVTYYCLPVAFYF
jgi:hypothetical protein